MTGAVGAHRHDRALTGVKRMAETALHQLRGPALRDNRMEVRELAPALLALGDLVREANVVANPDQPPVSLQIRATEGVPSR